MSSSRTTSTEEPTSRAMQRRARAAHDALGRGPITEDSVRGLVRSSWLRSLDHLPDPSSAHARLFCSEDELAEYRRIHPLSIVLPVIEHLLVRPALGAGMLVAVGDEHGRLLWVEGARGLRRRAEGMLFVAGADWSEGAVGTSAPGTSLILRRSVQIAGAEHFSPDAHPWSCTAVPVRDPDTGVVLGMIDVTGTAEAAAAHTLALMEAAVAAAEAHLSIHRLRSNAKSNARNGVRSGVRSGAGGTRDASARVGSSPRAARSVLRILGTGIPTVQVGTHSIGLSRRHAELLTLLALHPEGLSADRLALLAYPGEAAEATVRAEMLRLRRVLAVSGDTIMPRSRPYRLPADVTVDAVEVLRHLRRGAHRLALKGYRGPVLPYSQAPAIMRLRSEVSGLLRDAVLTDGSADAVLQYLCLDEAQEDLEAWRLALRVLPTRSPRRAAVVSRVERLEGEHLFSAP